MLPVPVVQELVLGRVKRLAPETVALMAGLGRVLAEDIYTTEPIPLWDNSAMDGYAVCGVDWASGQLPMLTLIEEVPAGKIPTQHLTPGTCSRVMTGAMLPVGTEAVVMQEQTQVLPNGAVAFLAVVRPGQFVRARGAFRPAGAQLIAAGTQITPIEIGILASLQRTEVTVYRQPIVGILSTGDELVPLGTPCALGQIPDSNQPTLAALVQQGGGIPRCLGIVRDRPEDLHLLLASCSGVDFFLSSGGVSVGSYDYVEQVLGELGAEILVRQVNMKPGKPLTFAQWGERLYWGLPGNPVSALVGFWLTVYPALRQAQGHQQCLLPELSAQLTQALKAGGDRRHYLRGRLFWQEGYYFEPFGTDNSANFANLSGVNGFAILEAGVTAVPKGTKVPVVALPQR